MYGRVVRLHGLHILWKILGRMFDMKKTALPTLLFVVIVLVVVLMAGCGGSSSPTVVPPVLIVESAPSANGPWATEPNMNGFVSVPVEYWQRVRPDSGETVSATVQAPQDGSRYAPNTAQRLHGTWRYDFVVTKEGQAFNISVAVNGN